MKGGVSVLDSEAELLTVKATGSDAIPFAVTTKE